MFQAGDPRRVLDRALDSPAATAAVMVVLLAMPVMASTGATESREAPRFEAYQSPLEASYNYQMRCWQHGRLVSEQFLFELPADRHPMAESGSDRDGLPVYLARAGNATCLVRGITDPGALPRH